MSIFRMIALSGCLVLMSASTASVLGQEKKPAAKEIDAATIAAYKKLGATYYRWENYRDFYSNAPNPQIPGRSLPTFQFNFNSSPVPKLPDVAVPFGLTIGEATDADMKQLASLKHLAMLNLGPQSKVTAAGLKELARLENLSELQLGDAQANASSLKEVAEYKGLRSLGLFSVQPTDAMFKGLAGIKNLEELQLWMDSGRGTIDLRPTDLKELSALKHLTTLKLGEFISDKNLRDLRDAGLLYALPNASGKDGARPKSADEVIFFYVVRENITPAGLKSLMSFKNLRSLRLSAAFFRESWLKEVAQFENLTSLFFTNISGNNPGREDTEVGLSELAKLKKFAALDVGGAKLTPEDIKDLATLTNLSTLNLAYTKITDADLKELASLKKLTSLNLYQTQVTNTGMKEVAGFKNLAKLSLGKTRVRDFGVRELAGLTNLTKFDLEHTEVTDAALRDLVGMKKLATLNLFGTRTTDGGIAELQKALPNCKIER